MNLVKCNFYRAHEIILSDPIKHFNNFLVSSYCYKLSICFKSRYLHFYVSYKVIMLLNQGLLHAMHKKSHTCIHLSWRNEADKLFGPFIKQYKFIHRRLVVSLTACEIAENWPHQGQYNIAYKHIPPFFTQRPM